MHSSCCLIACSFEIREEVNWDFSTNGRRGAIKLIIITVRHLVAETIGGRRWRAADFPLKRDGLCDYRLLPARRRLDSVGFHLLSNISEKLVHYRTRHSVNTELLFRAKEVGSQYDLSGKKPKSWPPNEFQAEGVSHRNGRVLLGWHIATFRMAWLQQQWQMANEITAFRGSWMNRYCYTIKGQGWGCSLEKRSYKRKDEWVWRGTVG